MKRLLVCMALIGLSLADHPNFEGTDDLSGEYQNDLLPPFLWAPFNHLFNPMIPYWTYANELNWRNRWHQHHQTQQQQQQPQMPTNAIGDRSLGTFNQENQVKFPSYPCYPNLQASLPASKRLQRFREANRCNGLYKCSNGRDESGCPQKCLEPLYSPEMFQRDCKQSKMRYQFNQETKTCEFFVYGGCVEKRNMFMKKSECERECARYIEPGSDFRAASTEIGGNEAFETATESTRVEVEAIDGPVHLEGTIPCSPGNATGEKMQYYNETDRCNGFYDCPNGDDEKNCMSKCLGFRYTETANVLDCRASIPRWYYDFETQKCVFFQYGGCAVVPNQFLTKAECEYECAGIYVNRTWAALPAERQLHQQTEITDEMTNSTGTTTESSDDTFGETTEAPTTAFVSTTLGEGEDSHGYTLISDLATSTEAPETMETTSSPIAIF